MARILAADIGATNSRFGHIEGGPGQELRLVNSVWLNTSQADSFAALMEQLGESELGLAPYDAEAICLALAGPVQGGVYVQPPHIPWDLDLERDRRHLGQAPVLLINDFVAQAFACRSPVISRAEQIMPGSVDYDAALAVIGAGSNLGHAALLPDGRGGHIALASEAGHAAFAFEGGEEAAYMTFLTTLLGQPYAMADTVVSGKGLKYVHWFLTGQELEPAQVAEELDGDSQTLAWMARFYGRACRQWALQVVALGGVYIAGGVAARNPALVRHPEFGKEFLRGGNMAWLLNQIPVFLNDNQESGLWGAALAASDYLLA